MPDARLQRTRAAYVTDFGALMRAADALSVPIVTAPTVQVDANCSDGFGHDFIWNAPYAVMQCVKCNARQPDRLGRRVSVTVLNG